VKNDALVLILVILAAAVFAAVAISGNRLLVG
jgi:hypothetical protein